MKYDPDLDLVFAALSDASRRAIVTRLARSDATVSELADAAGISLSGAAAHLAKLEASGLIASRKQGRIRTCSLAKGAFAPVQNWLTDQETIWNQRLDKFDSYALSLTQETDDDP